MYQQYGDVYQVGGNITVPLPGGGSIQVGGGVGSPTSPSPAPYTPNRPQMPAFGGGGEGGMNITTMIVIGAILWFLFKD